MLIELIVASIFLTLAIGALVSVYARSVVSLRHASIEGTATTLADSQIELYNTLSYGSIALAATTIPSSSSDPYVTAHASDATIPSSSGQVTGATASVASCTDPAVPQPACATQTVTGPDGAQYRVETYIVSVTPPTSGSRAIKQVAVIVRDIQGGVIGSIRTREQSAYDACNPPASGGGTAC